MPDCRNDRIRYNASLLTSVLCPFFPELEPSMRFTKKDRCELAVLLALLIWVLPMHADSVEAAKGERPNILWITAEDMDPDLGAYGDTYAKTPNLDRLANRGVRYTQCFATAPVCSPAALPALRKARDADYGWPYRPWQLQDTIKWLENGEPPVHGFVQP